MKKKIIVVIGLLFLAGMVVTTFVAQSRYQAGLPLVEMGIPRSGSVTVRREGEGIVEVLENGVCQTTLSFSSEDWVGAIPFRRGDAATVSTADSIAHGEVTGLLPGKDGTFNFLIQFHSMDVQAGDRVIISVEKQTSELDTVLPLSALQYDGAFYVWLVEEIPGPWGYEYAVKKEYVDIWHYGEDQVALSSQISLPVVLSAEQALIDGQTVRFSL